MAESIIPNTLNEQIATVNDQIATLLLNSVYEYPINISSYKTRTSPYTCPSDGYARVQTENEYIYGNNKDNTNSAVLIVGNGKPQSVFVRKGMRIYTEGGSSARFIPIE